MHYARYHRETLLLLFSLLLIGCGGSGTALQRPSPLSDALLPKRPDITVTPMTALNSIADDFGGTLGLDLDLIFFTSARKGATGKHSIFWSHRSGGSWSQPALAPALNTPESNGMPSISPGGEVMHFAGCDFGFGDCDIYRVTSGLRGDVTKETVPWTIPRNLGSGVNGVYWDSQPSVASDGSLLVFSSNRPGGYGGRDIWISLRDQAGGWGPPINAGSAINTVFDEITPWVAPDCRTLYFSSNGHPGIDGYDVYAVGLDPSAGMQVVTTAENLGRPINSAAHDIGFSLSADGSMALLSSNRSGGPGGYDLYSVSAVPYEVEPLGIVEGRVTNGSGQGLIADIEVVDLKNGNVIGRFRTDPESGRYRLVLRRGIRYAITAETPGYLYSTRMLSLPGTITSNTSYELEHTVQEMDGTIELLVFFATGSAILELESSIDLERAARFLRANEEVRVEIAGHTDNVGDPEENRELSLERARAVRSWLVGNRILSERIEIVGYGATKPIATNETESGRAQNRRVEMRILSK